MRTFFRLAVATVALLSPAALRAEIRLPALFSDHVVFQRDHAAWVGGRADQGEPVSRRLGDQTARGLTDDDGRWFEGDAVVASSPLVPEPVAARYAWAENSEADLFNAAGLPAGSWRPDDWPQSGVLTPPSTP